MAKNPHLVTPPNRLGDRIRRTGGPTPEQAILRALNAAEDLMDEYQGWAVDDLTKLWQAFEASVDGAPSTAQILQMFEIAHGIRGEGGSFGFPLVSVISDSLCKLLEGKRVSPGLNKKWSKCISWRCALCSVRNSLNRSRN